MAGRSLVSINFSTANRSHWAIMGQSIFRNIKSKNATVSKMQSQNLQAEKCFSRRKRVGGLPRVSDVSEGIVR